MQGDSRELVPSLLLIEPRQGLVMKVRSNMAASVEKAEEERCLEGASEEEMSGRDEGDKRGTSRSFAPNRQSSEFYSAESTMNDIWQVRRVHEVMS